MVSANLRLWLISSFSTVVLCLLFGVLLYPRGVSDEEKYQRAVTRESAGRLLSDGFEAHSQGKIDEAIAAYRHSMDIDPTITAGHYYLGTALASQGDYEGALKEFDRAIELNDGFAHYFNSRGAVRGTLGDTAGAISDFRIAASMDPALKAPRTNLALAYLRMDKPQEAESELDEAVKLLKKPEDGPRVIEARGISRAKLGRTQAAIEDLTLAVERLAGKTNVLRALHNRALAREAAGDAAGAQADRAEYARLQDMPEDSKRFMRPLKGAQTSTEKGTQSNGL